MNQSYCRSHKKTPYKLVYGNKPRGNCTLIEELFNKYIYDEENIPKIIKIDGLEDINKNLDDDMINEQDTCLPNLLPSVNFLDEHNNDKYDNYKHDKCCDNKEDDNISIESEETINSMQTQIDDIESDQSFSSTYRTVYHRSQKCNFLFLNF
ncbi:hypothetical protein RCL_jg18962.t2 [Rhizophagus clarus]|uniref:Uncharacterized protein n=1 Tax=Rhizophagus clarus TaxID=94130 RepID=A0A8H3R2S8_9GLOM|nr:hypothetical protein RCL_jg18956.t1 [Rhizophagus clarus]GET01242.1 hypothetical protein RCL_jg18962.t2 [Rhizophagus clarus]